jgi:hypothetical protein
VGPCDSTRTRARSARKRSRRASSINRARRTTTARKSTRAPSARTARARTPLSTKGRSGRIRRPLCSRKAALLCDCPAFPPPVCEQGICAMP